MTSDRETSRRSAEARIVLAPDEPPAPPAFRGRVRRQVRRRFTIQARWGNMLGRRCPWRAVSRYSAACYRDLALARLRARASRWVEYRPATAPGRPPGKRLTFKISWRISGGRRWSTLERFRDEASRDRRLLSLRAASTGLVEYR